MLKFIVYSLNNYFDDCNIVKLIIFRIFLPHLELELVFTCGHIKCDISFFAVGSGISVKHCPCLRCGR